MATRERLAINEFTTPQDKRWIFGAASPTTGTWAVGDVVFNTVPTAGGTFCWVCTTAGTSGTWKAVVIAA
jgi:hypothetical protein